MSDRPASPNPALVSAREAQALPRVPLLLLCAAYLIPGVFGRDPWRSADLTAYGYILALAEGRSSWLAPTLGGLPTPDGALLPYWLGAVFVKLLPWLDPMVASRIPFTLLLAATLALVWYATYHLARADSAQPLPLAFGGEAAPVDYARAIADGAVLALIASLGLLQLGHETTPELVQITAIALLLYGHAARQSHPLQALAAIAVGLLALASSAAPTVALLLAVALIGLEAHLTGDGWPRRIALVLAAAAVAALVAWALGAWQNRLGTITEPTQPLRWLRALAWFAWPVWLLSLYTLWRWRRRLLAPHLALPVVAGVLLLAVWLAMAGSDRALLLALPPMAVLSAFALPTLARATASAIDWFSVFFFTLAAIAVWLFYVAIQTNVPAKLAANVAKLSPGYENRFSWLALAASVLATLAWLWLVRWRTAGHRHPLWKSLVLPASGVSLIWLLVMTLLLPPLDNARSYRSLVSRLATALPTRDCIAAPDLPLPPLAALEAMGHWRIDAVTPYAQSHCPWLVTGGGVAVPADTWQLVTRERRLRREDDAIELYRRVR